MKHFVEMRRALVAATAALALAACGGGGGGASTPPVQPQPTGTPNGLLHVSVTSLEYGSLAPQTIQVTESGYQGALSVTSAGATSCTGIVSVAPPSASGPSASFAVTPSAPGQCALAVSDSNGNVSQVPVSVTLTGVTLQ
jgi:hypothetical protein